MSKTHSEIVICYRCSGNGYVDERTSAYDYTYKDCPVCETKGRLVKKITTEYEELR